MCDLILEGQVGDRWRKPFQAETTVSARSVEMSESLAFYSCKWSTMTVA